METENFSKRRSLLEKKLLLKLKICIPRDVVAEKAEKQERENFLGQDRKPRSLQQKLLSEE